MNDTVYNYTIIGAGAAGLQLALAMIEDSFFKEKKILILEKEAKDSNDRTWCFWEKGDSKWDDLVVKTWKVGQFRTQQDNLTFKLDPYRYKMLRSKDFYAFAKSKINAATNINWVNTEVKSVQTNEFINIQTSKNNFVSEHVFDSRIDPAFTKKNDPYFRVKQPFKGWFIETTENVFSPDQFVMMDYQVKWKNSTSFIYVLPLDERSCLIEFTFFTPELPEAKVYDPILKEYLNSILKIKNYEIKEVEQGVIPMSNYPFHQHHTKRITKIGTAGGWVKPSSGYAFKNSEKFAEQIVQNIKSGRPIAQGIAKGKHRMYDTLFLDLLCNKNETGESLFSSMYQKNSIQQIFKFLDEETSFVEDLKIMATFNPFPFLLAIAKQVGIGLNFSNSKKQKN